MSGFLLIDKNEPAKALGYFNKAKHFEERISDQNTLAQIYRGMAYSNWRLGNYSDSLALYNVLINNTIIALGLK